MLARLWRLLSPNERGRVLSFLPLMVLSALVEMASVAAVIPFLSLLADPSSASSVPVVGDLLGRWGGDDPARALRLTGLALAVAVVAANALLIFSNWWLFKFIWSLNHNLSSRLLRQYLSLPYSFMLTRNTADMSNKVMVEVQRLTDDGYRSAIELITRVPVVATLVAFLFVLDPITATIAIVTLAAVYGLIFVGTRRYLRRIGAASVLANRARMKAVNEALGGFVDLRVAGREQSAQRRYLIESLKYSRMQTTSQAISALPRYALEAIAVAGLVLISSSITSQGEVNSALPTLGAFAFAALRLMTPMQVLFYAGARMRYATGPLEAIEEDFQVSAPLEPVTEEGPPSLTFEAGIKLDGIGFSYSGGKKALTDVSLTLSKQKMLAIVGRTGSGKTTLVSVLLGLITPSEGTISVDGVAVTPENLRAYRRLFGYVPQSIYLVDDNIRRNVALGIADAEIDEARVRIACEQAQINDFIETELPAGYDTLVGERGVRLSGGQRQRIGIARALYHQPQILVFDEATSALDVHTEQRVYDALSELARTFTVITIAHRLNTVAHADQAVVMEHGRIAAAGAPHELIKEFEAGSVG